MFLGSQGKVFLAKGLDNRLKVWDVVSCKEKAQLVEKNHLANKYTCMSWGGAQKSSSSGATMLAAGTESGHIIVWDLNRGVVVQDVVAASHAIADLTFSVDCKTVYYVTTAGDVVMRQDISSKGGVREEVKMDTSVMGGSVSKLSVNPKLDNVMAAAGSSVGVVQLSSGLSRGLKATIAGGAGSLAFSSCGFFVACAGTTKREVLLFSTQATSKVTPVAVLTARGSIASVKARSNKARKGNQVEVLVILQEGGASVFRVRLGKDGSEESTEICNIKSKGIVLDAVFGEGASPMVVTARYETEKKTPVFDDVQFVEDNGELRADVVLPALGAEGGDDDGDDQTNGNGSVGGNDHGMMDKSGKRVLGPFEMGATKRPLTAVGGDGALEDALKKKSKAAGGEEGTTMEERLQKMSANLALAENSGGARKFYAVEDGDEANGAPSSDSLVTLISQALQSGDESLLEQCLACDDADVVEATSKRLDSAKVVALITKLTTKFEKRPARGQLMTDWLDALLRNHTSFLISVPELAQQLAGLSQMFEQRLSYYSKLAGLSGRLELLMSQFSQRGSGSQSDENALEPANVVFNVHG
jgi:U3 small nucleolar RNA-associated protein 5